MIVLIALICITATTVGSICGMGGGVIIKPVMDATGILSVEAVSFLSGVTVLAMTTVSVGKNMYRTMVSGEKNVYTKKTLFLAIGSTAGGILGKKLFKMIMEMSSDSDRVGKYQAIVLICFLLVTFFYMLNKKHIRTYAVENIPAVFAIGFVLGLISAFLGIGGGPMNLMVLTFFFSLESRKAASNSLFIIFFAQLMSLFVCLAEDAVPSVPIYVLIVMIVSGILGAQIGSRINKRIKNEGVEKLLMAVTVVILGINAFNIYKFM